MADVVALRVALLGVLVAGLLAAAVLVGLRVRLEAPRARPVVRVRHVLGPLALVAAVVALGVTPLGATAYEVAYEVTDGTSGDGSAGGATVPVGRSAVETVEVPLAALPGTTYVVDGSGVGVESWQRGGGAVAVTVRLPAAETPGRYRGTLRLTPYPAVLPAGTLAWLHDRHPAAAAAAAAVALVGPPFLLARLLLDGDRPLVRPRRRWLRRRLEGWP